MFTLLKFLVQHKGNVIYDCEFSDSKKNARQKILTTLIIGENGTGKSFLLATIADFFRYLSGQANRATGQMNSLVFKYDYAEISYLLGESLIEIKRNKSDIQAIRDGKLIELEQVIFPSRVLVLSFITNDKFSFSPEVDGFYSYLGVRATGNATYTSTIEKRLCSHITSIAKNEYRIKKLGDILEFLGMERRVTIKHDLKRMTLFKSKISLKSIRAALDKATDRKKYLSYNLNSISDREIDVLLINIEKLKSRHFLKSIKYEIDCGMGGLGIDSDELATLSVLENIEFISPPKVIFSKSDGFEFEHTSSGEKNILYTMISLLAATVSDSLLLIDEPEISLHPAWQMRYVNLLKNVLASFSDGHCILATHSHFMVSDIEPQDSELVKVFKRLENANLVRKFDLMKYSTYAWSAENILYEIFNLRTTRNYYFELELSELLSMISKRSTNINRMNELVLKFSAMVFNENDPLNILIEQAKSYVAEHD